MKKAYTVFWVFFLLLAILCTKTEAGTFTIGAKYWYETTWDSGYLGIFVPMYTDNLRNSQDFTFENIEYEALVGSGYLAGPLLGYQTDNGRWSFSIAAMVLSHFSQSVQGTSQVPVDISSICEDCPLVIPFETHERLTVDVTRRDYDFAASYSFSQSDSFLEYCKVFLGFKYQQVEYGLTSNLRIWDITSTETYTSDYDVYMPTLGIGIVYPFSENIAAGIQGGIGGAFFDGLNIDDSLTYNFEANVSIKPTDNIIIQLGYRYQEFPFDFHDPEFGKTYESKDKTYGPTLTITYAF